MSDAEWGEFQALAAQQARACEIILKADKLAVEIERQLALCGETSFPGLRAALEAFKVVRQGQ